MKGVIYARFSCDHQREESIEGQVRECRDYAEKNGIAIIGVYADRALTGKTDKRPQFQKMIKDSEKRMFEVVIVWKLDRFSRNRYDSATYKTRLKKNGVRVVSAKEQISDTPEGIILESMLEGMAEYYSADLAVKITRGMKENALKCRYNGGGMPFGYMVGPDQKLVINPQTAPIVVEIFQRYANGENIRDIIKSLNKRGIKTTRGSEFRQSSLDTMLTNTKYLGVYRSMGEVIEGGVPQIIDQELFDKVAARKQRNRKAPSSTKAPETYLLTTKLFCGKCGAMMAGESGKSHTGAKYLYYKCGNRKRAQGCKQKALRKEYVEKIVLDRIIQLVHQDSVIDEISESAARIQSQESTAIPLLRGQLRDVNKGIDNMLNAIQMGIITNSTKERLDELEAEKKKLELAIAEETLEHPDVPKEYFEHWLRHFRSGDVDDPEYRKLLVDIFVNAIYVTDDGLRFALNFFDGVETIPLREWDQAKGSDLLGYAPPTSPISNGRGFFLSSLRLEGCLILRIERLRTADDPIFAPAMALYAASFPEHEQRLEPSQRRIMAHAQYHFGLLCDGERFAGLALYWDAGAYFYVEHLCIAPERRGCGLGTAALDLLAEAGKPVILEIDPSVDEISRRRQAFYERAGFAANPHAHVHPPYRPENPCHALVVMSRPRPLTDGEYAAFAAYLSNVVMKDCLKP